MKRPSMWSWENRATNAPDAFEAVSEAHPLTVRWLARSRLSVPTPRLQCSVAVLGCSAQAVLLGCETIRSLLPRVPSLSRA